MNMRTFTITLTGSGGELARKVVSFDQEGPVDESAVLQHHMLQAASEWTLAIGDTIQIRDVE
jgi:hypothetical protein